MQSPPDLVLRRHLQQSSVIAIHRQDPAMQLSPTRDRWTEADVVELPAGEHDYFDRKSGLLFQPDPTRLLGPLRRRCLRSRIAAADI